jgi:hypothetical protein
MLDGSLEMSLKKNHPRLPNTHNEKPRQRFGTFREQNEIKVNWLEATRSRKISLSRGLHVVFVLV